MKFFHIFLHVSEFCCTIRWHYRQFGYFTFDLIARYFKYQQTYSDTKYYLSMRRHRHYDVTNKNNDISFECLNIYYWTRCVTSDDICLDLHIYCSIYRTRQIHFFQKDPTITACLYMNFFVFSSTEAERYWMILEKHISGYVKIQETKRE